MSFVAVKYIGHKPRKDDNVAGTELVWAPGQVHLVDPQAAGKLLVHASVWAVADDEDAIPTVPAASGGIEPVEVDEADMPLPNFVRMERADIALYARRAFGVDLDPDKLKKPDMIKSVVDLKNARAESAKLDKMGGVRQVDRALEDKAVTARRPGPPVPEVPPKVVHGFKTDAEREQAHAEELRAKAEAGEQPSESPETAAQTE